MSDSYYFGFIQGRMVWAGSRSKELIKSLIDFFLEKKMWHSENENAGKQHPFFIVFI